MKSNNTLFINLSIIFFASVFFIPFLGGVHLFDWDEINFAESAREMILTGDYLTVQIDFQPFWEKPPFFIWLQVISMKIFGINEFAARFPNAVCGIVTLLFLFNLGRIKFNKHFGILWTLAYAGSILPHLYFKSGIIDPWFNLFIFSGICFSFNYFQNTGRPKLNAFLAALLIGLSVLTKGPVGFLLFALSVTIYLIIKKFSVKFKLIDFTIFLIVFTLTGGFWFILQILNGNYDIIRDFVDYQIELFRTQGAGHAGFPGYHFVIIFFGTFPASVFALKSFRKSKIEINTNVNFKRLMIILLLVVLCVFSIVKTKIVHYSSLCYFPITFLAAYSIDRILMKEWKWNKWISILLISMSIIATILIFALQYIGLNADDIINQGLIKDKFTCGNLQAEVNWSGFEFIIGIFLILSIITTIIFLRKDHYKKSMLIFITGAIFINLILIFISGKIEKYTQNAAVEFYLEKQNEECYVETIGFKSYADIYYFDKQIPENENAYDKNWLLTGDIDKNAYFVGKITRKEEFLEQYEDLKILYEKNGFVFYERKSKYLKND